MPISPATPTNPGRDQILTRLWQLASLNPEQTRGSIAGQIKALSMIVAIEALIPDRRLPPAQAQPPAVSEPQPPTQATDEPPLQTETMQITFPAPLIPPAAPLRQAFSPPKSFLGNGRANR